MEPTASPSSLRTAPIRVRRATVSAVPRPRSPPLSDSAAIETLAEENAGALNTNLNRSTRRRGATITERLFSGDVYTQLDGGEMGPSSSNALGRNRSNSLSTSARRVASPIGSNRLSLNEEEHEEDEVDLLDVLDESVATTAYLTNIQSAFFPTFFSRAPVIDLPPPSPVDPSEGESDVSIQPSELKVIDVVDEDEDESDPLDTHLRKLLRKQKRKEKLSAALTGVWAFLKTPLGIAVGIYGFLVVFWGAGLVFVLIIPFQDDYTKKLWIEIASQVLTALFTITGIGMFPSRLIDTYYISIIYSLSRRTNERRVKMGLERLRDINDLPDSEPVEIGGVVARNDLERGSEEDVLTEIERTKLRHAQIKFGTSQTWYRPHESPTHHAFPIGQALLVTILIDLNSVFQALLCGVMWGIKGVPPHNRPAWTTATFIVGSFGCGLAGAVIIGVQSEKTKKKKEVTRKVWAMLKADEELLIVKKKEVEAEKERKKKLAKGRQSMDN